MRLMHSALLALTFISIPVRAQDTVQVSTGWNIVGALSSGPISESLVSVPPGLMISGPYEYVPGGGYVTPDSLKKGTGYWVKVGGNGILIFDATPLDGPCGVRQVLYAGGLYNTVQIGSQCWLKENLNVGVRIDSLSDPADNGVIEKYCYLNDLANCSVYGGLYQWDEAMQYSATPAAGGICPAGWHIPTGDEFDTLRVFVGNDGNALKANGQGTGGGAGTNTSGFSALLAGFRDPSGVFYNLHFSLDFWISEEGDAIRAVSEYFTFYDNTIQPLLEEKHNGYSVRCLED